MHLTSGFLSKQRDISQLNKEELEDLEYHLQHRRDGLIKKLEQINRDLADLAEDQEKISTELRKRRVS